MTSVGSMSTVCTVTPRSSAIARHVLTFASWSRVVTTISSPGPSVAPIERPRWSVRLDMFWPNLISSGLAAPRKSATAACASSTIASDRRLVVNAPPALAFASRVVADDRVDHPLRDLRATRSVEEDDGSTVLLARESGELRPQGIDIEPGHRASSHDRGPRA